MDNGVLLNALLRDNIICTPFVTMRRNLFERLGDFIVDFKGDDYDYWFRCLGQGCGSTMTRDSWGAIVATTRT